MPRFVLLFHDCPPDYERASHWDLMLEAGEALRTWAVPRLPSAWKAYQARTAASGCDCSAAAGDDSVIVEQLADHRPAYLVEEGALSGGRGDVRRVDGGTYVSESETPGCWQITLAGKIWQGRITLKQAEAAAPHWTLSVDQSAD